jgi:large subunit ribosomal protein L13
MAKPGEVEQKCYLIDANNKVLGKIATKTASILRGKHKPTYTPHTDTGDMVIVINAEKVRVTGNKLKDKVYERYSGYPSGQRSMTLENMLKKSPKTVIELAVKRMIPSGALGNSAFKKLKVYAGETHPHAAQKPVVLEI